MRFKRYCMVLSITAAMILTGCATQKPVWDYQPVTTPDITLAQTEINYAPNYTYVTTISNHQKTLSTIEGKKNDVK